MDELKADVVATTDPELTKRLNIKELIDAESTEGERRTDSEGNEETSQTITTTETLDNHRVVPALSSLHSGQLDITSPESSSDHSNTDDSSIVSRNSSVDHTTDDTEAMDCSTSPCSDHSDEESDL